ncbi:hypothetical protein [Escherichia coli]
MYLLEHRNPSGTVNQFHIDVSEDGLMIYESCINYVLENCSDQEVYEITGCENREALKEIQKDIISILYYHAARDLFPARYLEPTNRNQDLDELSYIGINMSGLNK